MNKLQPTALSNQAFFKLLLALAPLLLMSTTAASALFLGLISYLVLVITGLLNTLIGARIPANSRLLFVVLISSSLVSIIHLLLQAYHSDAAAQLNLLLPLVATNALLLLPYISNDTITLSQQHKQAVVFVLALLSLAVVREVLATGALFSDISLFFGEISKHLQINFVDRGLLLAQLAPGAFIILGLLLALLNKLSANKKTPVVKFIDTSERRARVTGRIA